MGPIRFLWINHFVRMSKRANLVKPQANRRFYGNVFKENDLCKGVSFPVTPCQSLSHLALFRVVKV